MDPKFNHSPRPQRSNHRQFVQVNVPTDERERLDNAVGELTGCVELMRQHPQVAAALEQLKRVNAMSKLSTVFGPKG